MKKTTLAQRAIEIERTITEIDGYKLNDTDEAIVIEFMKDEIERLKNISIVYLEPDNTLVAFLFVEGVYDMLEIRTDASEGWLKRLIVSIKRETTKALNKRAKVLEKRAKRIEEESKEVQEMTTETQATETEEVTTNDYEFVALDELERDTEADNTVQYDEYDIARGFDIISNISEYYNGHPSNTDDVFDEFEPDGEIVEYVKDMIRKSIEADNETKRYAWGMVYRYLDYVFGYQIGEINEYEQCCLEYDVVNFIWNEIRGDVMYEYINSKYHNDKDKINEALSDIQYLLESKPDGYTDYGNYEHCIEYGVSKVHIQSVERLFPYGPLSQVWRTIDLLPYAPNNLSINQLFTNTLRTLDDAQSVDMVEELKEKVENDIGKREIGLQNVMTILDKTKEHDLDDDQRNKLLDDARFIINEIIQHEHN